MRKLTSLNFNWYFIPDFKVEYLHDTFDFRDFEPVNIPHTMTILPLANFNEKESQIIGTYFKEFTIENKDENNHYYLQFMGVMTTAKVYLNNQEIFLNEGGYTPFEIPVNKHIKIGKNILKVIVDGNEIKDIPPFGGLVDYLPYSGIYREVFLLEKPQVHFITTHLFSDDINVIDQTSIMLNIKVIINDNDREFGLKVKIQDRESEIINHAFSEKFVGSNIYSIALNNIKRWNIESPNLYDVKLSLINDGLTIDEMTIKFGFRTMMFTETGFLLNNHKIKLMGLNRHQSYPYIGYAAPKSMQEMDAEILKNLGVNIVRTSHYMQSDHFLNRCDELGILVLEEIPGWNYIGNDHFKELSLKNLAIMIDHHFNHPSIVLWGVRINESKDDDKFYQKTNALAKEIDPSRQTGGVRNFKKSNLLEDVYTYNDFSHTGENDGLEAVKAITKSRSPYLVTEYGGHVFPTKKTDSQERRIEHSLRHLNVIEYNHYYDNISGAIGWCMADYNTHFQFGSNDHICHHGVMDIHRIEKYAAYPYKSQKNPQEEVVLFVANNMIAGDFDLLKLPEIVVYTNCEYIKVYKNDVYIDTIYPDRDNYEYMPHPPIIIKDLIGKQIELNEPYKKKDAKKIKKVLLSFSKYGFDMPFKDKLTVLNLMMRKIINMDDAINLFSKYLANQELTPTIFKFEGYLADNLVKTVYRGHMMEAKMIIEADRNQLHHDLTYDMTRIVVKMIDQFVNILDYANEVVTVETADGLEVVGPKSSALNGGSTAFYIRTIAPVDKTKVVFNFNHYPSQELEFTIK